MPIGVNLSDLRPGTVYHYRVSASNVGGTAYGQDQTFRTLDDTCDTDEALCPPAKPVEEPKSRRCGKGRVLRKGHCVKKRRHHSQQTRPEAPPCHQRGPLVMRPLLRTALACLATSAAAALLAAAPASAAFLTPEYDMTFSGSGEHQLGESTAIAVDEATHDVYVADRTNHRVEKFDSEGNFLLTFGNFTNPTAVAVDNSDGASKGDVYVAQGSAGGGDGSIAKFDSSGQPVTSFGTAGKITIPELRKMTVSPFTGDIWVLDELLRPPGPTAKSTPSTRRGSAVQKRKLDQNRRRRGVRRRLPRQLLVRRPEPGRR